MPPLPIIPAAVAKPVTSEFSSDTAELKRTFLHSSCVTYFIHYCVEMVDSLKRVQLNDLLDPVLFPIGAFAHVEDRVFDIDEWKRKEYLPMDSFAAQPAERTNTLSSEVHFLETVAFHE